MTTTPRALLDASALVAWLLEERGEQTIDRLLPVSAISTVNLAEAFERVTQTEWSVESAVDELRAVGLTLLPFEAEDAALVPQLRRAGRKLPGAPANGSALSLGDCCCLAVAVRRQLAVITDDGAWTGLDLAVPVHLFR